MFAPREFKAASGGPMKGENGLPFIHVKLEIESAQQQRAPEKARRKKD
jgi:hypothetical protein